MAAMINNKWPLEIIVSGGQTGADQAGLRAAKALGYSTGGMAPRHYRTETGQALWLKTEYGLAQSNFVAYHPRTTWNVKNSDGTLIFGNHTSPGSQRTITECERMNKPFLLVAWPLQVSSAQAAQTIQAWISQQQIHTVNVAGNRESVNPGIGAAVEALLLEALQRP